jgi:hypothetical protein
MHEDIRGALLTGRMRRRWGHFPAVILRTGVRRDWIDQIPDL